MAGVTMPAICDEVLRAAGRKADHQEDLRDEYCQESFAVMWRVMRLCIRTLRRSALGLIKQLLVT